ncbi:MAG: type III pantothenate kinase [Flavobacteriales bacterium]|nr:type III pantothenate kinase [Bacteroidota bacterium]MCB9240496.1 type III pantothenate kinase [Flavobacteriales bacterium]
MELIIDEGNTRVKLAIFINNGINRVIETSDLTQDVLDQIDETPDRILYCSTRKTSAHTIQMLQAKADVLVFDHHTPIPIHNDYRTPDTLGSDRIAAVIGARFLQNDGPLLTIDAGTCITYDLLTADDRYVGGKISPGSAIRFKSLHDYTGNLPLVEQTENWLSVGHDTITSIQAGVLHGLCAEINQTITDYESQYQGLHVFLTGGEARYFVNHIKRKIFANRNLVLLGLHKILKFNDKA